MFVPSHSDLGTQSLQPQSTHPIYDEHKSEEYPKPIDTTGFSDVDIERGFMSSVPDNPPTKHKRTCHWKLWQGKSQYCILGMIFVGILAVAIVIGTLTTVMNTHRRDLGALYPHAPKVDEGHGVPHEHEGGRVVKREAGLGVGVGGRPYVDYSPSRDWGNDKAHIARDAPKNGDKRAGEWPEGFDYVVARTASSSAVVAPLPVRGHDSTNTNGTVALTKPSLKAASVDDDVSSATVGHPLTPEDVERMDEIRRPAGGPSGGMITGIVFGVPAIVAGLFVICCFIGTGGHEGESPALYGVAMCRFSQAILSLGVCEFRWSRLITIWRGE